MKLLALAICVAVVAAQSATTCIPVACATDETFQSDECWLYKSTPSQHYALQPCHHLLTCGLLDSRQVPGTPVGQCGPPQAYAADGEDCVGVTDCKTTGSTSATVKCTDRKCTGYLSAGQACTATTDCQVGYWCDTTALSPVCTAVSNSGVCTPFAVPGTSSCENNMTCIDKKCVTLGDAKGGETCNFYGDCASFYCDPNEKRCAYGTPMSAIPAPQTCNPGSSSDCISKTYKNWNNQDETVSATCKCGYSQKGNAYCDQLSGDPDYQQLIVL